MANATATFGFRHIGYLSGYAPDYQQSVRAILKTNATAIGYGDPVARVSSTSPYIQQCSGSQATTAGIEGIFVGCTYQVAGQPPVFSPGWPGVTAAADATGYVIDAPGALFLAGTLQTAIGSADIGKVVNFTTLAASTTGGMFSNALLDQATLANAGGTAISSLPFKVVGLYGSGTGIGPLGNMFGGVGNGTDPTSNNNWVIVTFNNQVNRNFVGF